MNTLTLWCIFVTVKSFGCLVRHSNNAHARSFADFFCLTPITNRSVNHTFKSYLKDS